MKNLIAVHGWIMNEQNYLKLKEGNYILSIIPEYTYYAFDQYGRIYRTDIPQDLVLRIAIMPKVPKNNTFSRPSYFSINSEVEFIDFMAGLTKEIKLETLNLEKAI